MTDTKMGLLELIEIIKCNGGKKYQLITDANLAKAAKIVLHPI
jgi:hypothetical protein